MKNIYPIRQGGFRVRVQCKGESIDAYCRNLKEAVATRDRIVADNAGHARGLLLTDEDAAAQVEALPPGTNYTRNITRQPAGFRVLLGRGKYMVYGGYFSLYKHGSRALAEAVAARDEAEALYPASW